MKVSDLVNDTDDLRHEIKSLNRENREQSVEAPGSCKFLAGPLAEPFWTPY